MLFALIDACDQPAVPQRADRNGSAAASLYLGWAAREFWAVAPYLFVVDESTLEWILSDLWGQPWGVFLVTEASFDDVRRHLRKFLYVRDPDDRKVYFRFYDPRVLPTFLESADEATAREFFGPIAKFAVANGDNELLSIEAAFKTWGRLATR